jgi:hypothetical protein
MGGLAQLLRTLAALGLVAVVMWGLAVRGGADQREEEIVGEE